MMKNSQTRWMAGFSPNGECRVRRDIAVPVLWSACQPCHQGRRGGRSRPLIWGETKGSVCLGSVARSESHRHGLALGRHGGVAPTRLGDSQLE